MKFYNSDDLKDDEIYLKLIKTVDEQPEKRWVPSYYFDICLLDGTKIGKCDLRVGHNDKTYIGGNIGYGILQEYRGHHYSLKATKLLFNLARKHQMEYVIITCNPDNLASSKIIEEAGGKLLEITDIPIDNEMYEEGKRKKVKVYKITL